LSAEITSLKVKAILFVNWAMNYSSNSKLFAGA
jgi:hypothetical protein